MKIEQRIIRENQELKNNVVILSVAVGVIFFVLVVRLWYLQIVQSENYHNMSENNRLRLVPVAASRGAILDRNGKIIVGNRPSFSVGVIKQDVTDKERLFAQLSRYLGLDITELNEKWEKAKGAAKYYPIIVDSGIDRDELELLEENRLRLPGVDIEMKPVRDYVNGLFAVHLLGYLGEIGDQELGTEQFKGYNPGDYTGKSGIEKRWEHDLHGADGGRQIEVDARGRILRTVNESSPTVGNSLMLTIDADVQKAAEKGFGEQAGGAVAIEINTGEVLAFVSNPMFDPSLFTGKMSKDQWKGLMEDKRHPLENKALKGQYPPGSTFKIITAIAGLEEGLIDENTSVTCTGSYKVGNHTFKCWDKKGHGTVNLKKALRESCDVYFYQLGERLGVDKIATYARMFNLGTKLGIGLDNEKAGLIPDSAWKEKRFHQKWMRGETIPVSIGQGYVLTTPIQLAAMTAAVAGDGTIYRPHLVKKVVDQEGKTLKEFRPEVVTRAKVKPKTLELVREGLFSVVNDPHGTGAAARMYEVKVAGKTGTSQVVKLRDGKGGVPYQYRDHALFVAFAPYEKPEIAVAVIVEHGEHGGSTAAPIAARMLRAYFESKGVIKKPVPAAAAPKSGGEADVDVEDGAAEEAD